MAFTTVSIRVDVARRLKAAKGAGESYSDTLERLLENQPAKTVEEWLASVEPIEGRSLFSPKERAQLKHDQLRPRPSPRKRRVVA